MEEASQIVKTQATELTGANSHFGTLMQAFFLFSNDIPYYLYIENDSAKAILNWIGVVADMQLLKLFFGLRSPTVIAIWENTITQSFQRKHGKA